VFGNDEQIDDFLQSKNKFECANSNVDSDNDTINKLDSKEINGKEENSFFLQFKDNILPRGLVPLE
jgi:hypothetical protein